MAFISETLQMRRLTESGVNIKTTYIVDGTLRYRSTDGTCQDDVHSGIRCRKEYFRQGKLLHTEKIFDSRMEYIDTRRIHYALKVLRFCYTNPKKTFSHEKNEA